MLRAACSEASAGGRLFCVGVPELPTHFPPLCLTCEAVQDLHAGLSPGAPGQGADEQGVKDTACTFSKFLISTQTKCLYFQKHKVVNIVLRFLVWGTKHPFTKQETQC